MRNLPNTNSLRAKVTAFAHSEGICTRCFCRASENGLRQCEECNKRKTIRRINNPEKAKAYHHAHYLKHRTEKLAKTKAYKAKRKSEETDVEKAVRLHNKL